MSLPPPTDTTAVDDGDTEQAWTVAANVVFERAFGEGGIEKRSGTKHFAPGAKVYVISFYWGMGAQSVTVVGRHRKSHRYICVDMRSKHLANWRAEVAYSPWVVRQIVERGRPKTRQQVEEEVAHIVKNLGEAKQPYIVRPPTADQSESDSGENH